MFYTPWNVNVPLLTCILKMLLFEYRQNVPVEVKIACISYVLIFIIYILCLDRQVLKMMWKMHPNVAEAHYLTPGTTWHSVAFFFGKVNILLKIVVFFLPKNS